MIKKMPITFNDKLHRVVYKIDAGNTVLRIFKSDDSFEIDYKKAGNGGTYKTLINTKVATLELAKAKLSLILNKVIP